MLRISSMLLAILLSGIIYSQECDTTSKYKPSFGFSLGLNQSVLYNSGNTDELQIENAPGFRLGIITSFPLGERWAVAPKAELSFNFGSITENNVKYRVDPNNLDFMTHVKYSFKGYNKIVKPYCYFGPNLRVPLNGEFSGVIYDTQASLALDFAFGVDIDAKYFLISPEIRFSGGLTDIRKNASGSMLRGSNAVFVLNFSGN